MKKLLITSLMIMFLFAWADSQETGNDSLIFKESSIGAGLGIPYGILGLNVDINVIQNLNASLGVGTTILSGVGYSLGLKYFLRGSDKNFRPRISAYYGINTLLAKIWGPDEKTEIYAGLNMGIGAQWMWGQSKSNGLDLDIIFIITSGLDIDNLRTQGYSVSEPNRMKLSIGYRHAL